MRSVAEGFTITDPQLDAHGGALVNLIHGYAENGDPFIRKFTNQLLEEVTTLCQMLLRRPRS